MASLSAGDLERILGIVAAAAAGTAAEPLPPVVLEEIRTFIGADVVAYFEGAPWNRTGRRVWAAGQFEPWSAEERQAMDRFRFQVPLNPSAATIGRSVRVTDVMSLRAFRRLDIYQLGRPHGVEYTMDHWMATTSGRTRGLRFDGSTRDFDERARDRLDVLAPHLATVLGRFDRSRPAGHPGASDARLTKRQAEVLQLVAAGRTNRQIAALLGTSSGTIRKHVENAYDVLGIHSRAEAAAWVVGRELASA